MSTQDEVQVLKLVLYDCQRIIKENQRSFEWRKNGHVTYLERRNDKSVWEVVGYIDEQSDGEDSQKKYVVYSSLGVDQCADDWLHTVHTEDEARQTLLRYLKSRFILRPFDTIKEELS